MEQAAGLILAANGNPFSDRDAARIKAQTISLELGEPYDVISHPTGGFAIRRAINATIKPASEMSPTEKRPAAEARFSQGRGPIPGDSVSDNPFEIPTSPPLGQERPVTWTIQNTEKTAPSRSVESEADFQTLVLRPAWRGYWKLHLLSVTGLIVALFPSGVLLHIFQVPSEQVASIARYGMLPLLSLIGLTGALTAFTYAIYGRYANRFTAKPELLESCFGIFARKSIRAEYAHIRSVDIDQGVIDRILNIGTIEVATAATADAEVIFAGISDPLAMQEEIYRRRRFGRMGHHADE